MGKIAVIGSGPMGLICAYDLLKAGYDVEVFERDSRIGGMSASFDLDGLIIERFYHFICATDYAYFEVLKELGIFDKLVWRPTKMGFYYEGKLYKWSNPFHLLRFPHMSLLSKIRYSAHILYCKYVRDWKTLDRRNAIVWLKKWIGAQAYRTVWENLLHYKYHELKENISAAWIASRIQRVAKSRKSIFTEEMGYLEGGSETLLAALRREIEARRGIIRLSAGVEKIASTDGRVRGVLVNGEEERFDGVISTVPLPIVVKLAEDLTDSERARIGSIQYVGVICIVFKLSRRFSENFWMNINDSRIELPGVIEYSNLYPQSSHILYVPYYMPVTHPDYRLSDTEFLAKSTRYLKLMRPDFSESWIESSHVARYHCAQALCTPHFFATLPPMRTSIQNFLMADTSYYYPEDRSISESIRLGRRLAELFETTANRT